MIALGRLGWSLRRIEAATGVRRETAGGYLRSAGIALRTPGGWGRKAPAKAAASVTICSASSKPANEVITGLLLAAAMPEQVKRRSGAGEAYREPIELELSRGRNAMGIWQLCRARHSCQNAEFSTMPSEGQLASAFALQMSILTDVLQAAQLGRDVLLGIVMKFFCERFVSEEFHGTIFQ